jgi:hypothetical protein
MPNRGTRLGSQGFGVESSIYLMRMQEHPHSPALATLFVSNAMAFEFGPGVPV